MGKQRALQERELARAEQERMQREAEARVRQVERRGCEVLAEERDRTRDAGARHGL
jgi:hypothetical protein